MEKKVYREVISTGGVTAMSLRFFMLKNVSGKMRK